MYWPRSTTMRKLFNVMIRLNAPNANRQRRTSKQTTPFSSALCSTTLLIPSGCVRENSHGSCPTAVKLSLRPPGDKAGAFPPPAWGKSV